MSPAFLFGSIAFVIIRKWVTDKSKMFMRLKLCFYKKEGSTRTMEKRKRTELDLRLIIHSKI
jgi:hypothetical protein